MKIISPSATIIEDELAVLSIYERIERAGRICYRSEDKIAEGTAVPFCERIVKSGHFSVLEMAMVSVSMPTACAEYITMQSKYVVGGNVGSGRAVITGSIRAWMELGKPVSLPLMSLLHSMFPLFFEQPRHDWHGENPYQGAAINEIPADHRHVAVKFIVNRAVSHELVRHRPCSFLQESQRYCGYNQGKFGGEVTFIDPGAFFADDAIGVDYKVWKDSCAQAEKAYLQLIKNGRSPQSARTVLPNSTKTEIIVYASLPEWEHIFDLRCSPAADPSMREIMIPLREEFRERGLTD